MTEVEFKPISAAVIALWPTSAWPDATIAVAFSLLHRFEARHVSRAVANLAREGREFAPPPGVVFVYAQAIEREQRPLLAAAETTPSDWARSRTAVKGLLRQIADIAAGKQLVTTRSPK